MNLNQLTYFVTLAKIQHYTKAAKRLDISQPSLSHSISTLEEELEVPLFERQGRNVILTRYGEIFLEYVERSLQILHNGIEQTREAASIVGGKISIGYIYTQGSVFIPHLVKGFLETQEEKKIDFQFHNDVSSSLIRDLKEGRYDVIFCSRAEGERDITFIPVAEEKLVAIVPLSHPLAEKESVSIKELGEYPLIGFPPSSGLYFVIEDLFEKAQVVPHKVFEIEEDSALAGMVAEGFGVGIVPDVPSVRTLPVKRIPIDDLSYRRYIYMGVLKKGIRTQIVEELLKYIEKNYRIHE